MPFQDMSNVHFDTNEEAQFRSLMDQLFALIGPKLRNLSEEENNKVGTVDEDNKLFINKDRDYYLNQPALSSADVDWVEFQADYFDRGFLENGALRLEALAHSMTETKRLHDYDNYENARIDYKYSQYKNELQPGAGYDSKVAELGQFFKKTASPAEPTPPTPPGPLTPP